MSSFAEEVLAELERLPPDRQRVVLDFVRALSRPGAIAQSGSEVVHLAGSISPEDLAVMKHVADEECERIDADAW